MANAKSDRINRSPTHLLHRVLQCAEELFRRELGDKLGDKDLTPRQLAVMMTVAESEGLNQKQIGEETGIDRATLGQIVVRLTRRGWLQRQRTREDTRAYAVRLTAEGRTLLVRAIPLASKVDTEILRAMPRKGPEDFFEQLQCVVTALECVNVDSKPA